MFVSVPPIRREGVYGNQFVVFAVDLHGLGIIRTYSLIAKPVLAVLVNIKVVGEEFISGERGVVDPWVRFREETCDDAIQVLQDRDKFIARKVCDPSWFIAGIFAVNAHSS